MKVYLKRDHWEDREDSEWRIDTDALVYRDAFGREYRFPWKDIAGVRVEWRKRNQRPCHVCSVWLEGEERSRCEFDNLHVVTVGEYEYREDYSEFLKAVLIKVIEKSPSAKAWTGMHRGLYPWVLVGGVLFAIAALSLIFTPQGSVASKVIALLTIILWTFTLVRERPRTIRVGDLLQRVF